MTDNINNTVIVPTGTITVSTHTNTAFIVLSSAVLDITVKGAVTGATIDGGIQIDYGKATATTVTNGGIQYVFGKATGTVLSNGGVQIDYGKATGTVVSDGCAQDVLSGGVATNTTIEAGGYQGVSSAKVVDTVVYGDQEVLAKGTANDTTIESGGFQYVGSGGTSSDTDILANGLQYVDTGGQARDTEIDNGGIQAVVGTATGTVVDFGGLQEVVGLAKGTTVASGAIQYVLLGGLAKGTTVESGGFQQVGNGTVSNTQLSGFLQVLAGGASINTDIVAGGGEYVASGGSANSTTIEANSGLYADVGSTTTNTTINGGFEAVAGTANATTVNSGELDVIGLANDTHLQGGVEYVYAGGVQNNLDFKGSSATLYLADLSGLTGTISHFEVGDTIDLLNTAVSSFNFDNSTLTLATSTGSYAYQFADLQNGTEFNVTSDGKGGTAISLSLLVQQSASLAPECGPDGAIVPQDTAEPKTTLCNVST